jgi:hypothetical protein
VLDRTDTLTVLLESRYVFTVVTVRKVVAFIFTVRRMATSSHLSLLEATGTVASPLGHLRRRFWGRETPSSSSSVGSSRFLRLVTLARVAAPAALLGVAVRAFFVTAARDAEATGVDGAAVPLWRLAERKESRRSKPGVLDSHPERD